MASAGTTTVSTSQHASRNERRPARRIVVTGTGFSSQEREVVKEWVLELGLQYSGDLVCKFSTHLVCKDLLAAFNETKYVKAVHWGITIVSFRWIYDSLLVGRLLPTAGYNSDSPSPADVALREAVFLLRKRQEASQQAPRSPLQELSANSQDLQGLICGPSSVAPDAKLHDRTWAVLQRCNTNNKKRPAGHQQEAAAQDDFTFDVPCVSRPLLSSPAFCGAQTCLDVGAAAGSQLSAAGKGGVCTALQGQVEQLDASAKHAAVDVTDCAAQPLLSPPDRSQPHPSGQLPTPSTIDISFSQLDADITITVPEDNAAHMAGVVEDDDNSTPKAGVHQTGLHLAPDSAAFRDFSAGGERAANAVDMCSPAADTSVGRVGVEHIDLLMPVSSHVQATAVACNAVEGDGAVKAELGKAPMPATWQHGAEAGVLYSGFSHIPLSPLNKAAKGRRLVRTDRMSMAAHGVAAGKCADGKLPSHANLEDDLKHPDDLEDDLADDLEDDLRNALPRVADVPLNPQVVQQERQQLPLGPPLEQRIANPVFGSAVLTGAASVRIKAEPSCKADRNGPIMVHVPDAEGLAAGGKLSARRRAAALATNSLVSEPEPMLMASRPAVGRGAAAAAMLARVSRMQPGKEVDEYGTDRASSSTSTDGTVSNNVENLDISAGPSPNFDHRGTVNGFMSSVAQGDLPMPSSLHHDALPETIPESDLEDKGYSTHASGGAFGPRHQPRYGRTQARNAPAVKPLPRVGSHKAGRQHRGEGMDTAPGIGTVYALDPSDSDKDRQQPSAFDADADDDDDLSLIYKVETGSSAKARASLVSGLSQSLLQSLSLSQSASQQQLAAGSLQWPREPLADENSISQYLELQVAAAEEYLAKEGPSSTGGVLSDGDIRVVKSIRRTKAQTVSERHPGVMLKAVQFAEQVSVDPLDLLLHCRDRNKRARCPIIALGSDHDVADATTSREVFLAEPYNIYRLPNGEWWLEYRRYYSIHDLNALAEVTGQRPNLPSDFNTRREVVCDTDMSHCRVIHVRGNMQMTRTKKANPPGERGRAAGTGCPVFCRFAYNRHTGLLTVHQQVADLVID